MNKEKRNGLHLLSEWYGWNVLRGDDQIFFKSWFLIGAESQISNPVFFIFINFDQLIEKIAKRLQLKTFFNIYRVRIFKENTNNKSLVCTYHGWTYLLL